MGLKTGIWASRLGFEEGETEKEEEEEDKKEEEKIPHMCERIGHRPLRGRCPKMREVFSPLGQVKENKEEKEERKGKGPETTIHIFNSNGKRRQTALTLEVGHRPQFM